MEIIRRNMKFELILIRGQRTKSCTTASLNKVMKEKHGMSPSRSISAEQSCVLKTSRLKSSLNKVLKTFTPQSISLRE